MEIFMIIALVIYSLIMTLAWTERYNKWDKLYDKNQEARKLIKRAEILCYQSLQNRRNGRIQELHDDIEKYFKER